MNRRHDDEGQILIAVLIVVVVISVVVGVILGFADTDFKLTSSTRAQRQQVYAADAALDAAINYYNQQGAASANRCPDSTWTAPTVNGVTGVTVACVADGANAAKPTNFPSAPIITRGNADSQDGINVNGGALLPARGGNIYSEGRISVSSGASLYDPVDAGSSGPAPTVRVLGSCNPTPPDSVYNPQPTCNATYNALSDPPADATVFTGNALGNGAVVSPYPTATAVPPCPGGGAPLTLTPGRYTDLAALTARTSCTDIFWLQPGASGPGIYQFDFSGQWTIGNGELLLGGTPTGTLATSLSRPAGSRCTDTSQGVQVVFSSEARINLSGGGSGGGGAMEICPPLFADTTTQRVAVWGPTTPGPVSTTVPAVPLAQTSTGSPKYAPTAGAALAGDLSVATVTVDHNKNAVLDATFTPPAIPAGATITKVEVAIAHGESGVSPFPAGWSLSATVSSTLVTGGAAFTYSPALSAGTTTTTDVVGTFNTAAKLAGLKVSYKSTATNSAPDGFKSDLDGIAVTITYSTAVVVAFAGQSGCIVSAAAGNCPMLQTTGNSTMTLKGTIFAPLAFVDIALNNSNFQVFGRGVVLRRLDTNITPSVDCPIPPPNDEDHDKCFAFQLPRNKAAGDKAVFVATVNGRVRARARVSFSGATPVILNWSNTNEAA